MAQGQRRGGGGQRQPQQQRQPTQNEQISADQQAQQKMQQLFREIKARRPHIEAVLPTDIPFQKFEACLAMAIRREPKLLDCYGPSLIKAAIQSAYDGLMPDGREAVILYRRNSKANRIEANYQSMAYGLRKKIVEAGAARHIEATCVYKNEPFRYAKGLNPVLEHEPILDDARRGELWAVYSVAILPDGDRVFEVMTKGDVMAVKAVAMTTDVWDKWEAEMWRKSVLRRHSKALPTSTPIRDAEALEMFPQFSGQQPAQGAIAGTAPPRPTRDQFAQLDHQPEAPFDLSGFMSGEDDEREHVVVDQGRPAQQTVDAKAKQAQNSGDDDRRGLADQGVDGAEGNQGEPERASGEVGGGDRPAAEEPVPVTAPEWERWSRETLLEIGRCRDVAGLDELNKRHLTRIEKAPPQHKRTVANSFADKRIDLQENGDGQD